MKYVITGGPCAGKTTLLEGLARNGFLTLPESARQIIAEEQLKDCGVLPWQDLERFQYKVIRRQLKNEEIIKGGVCLLDRGLIDCLAYMEKDGITPSNELYSLMKSANYDKIFLLDPLDIYKKDSERKETMKEARIIHEYISDNYRTLGFEVINVPNMEIKERLDFTKDVLKYG